MKYEYLVFDLDGTISDPKDGIVKSLNYALSAHGFATQDEDELSTFIGPPLDNTFIAITKSDDPKLVSSLVSKYRERYSDIGFSENILYEGIPEALEQLSLIPDIKLGICTSKRADFAERILDLFGLRNFFGFVNGGDVGIEKWQQLGSLLEQSVINRKSVMIGDRYIDITAAQKISYIQRECCGVTVRTESLASMSHPTFLLIRMSWQVLLYNKHIKNRPQKAWAGLANARLLCERYVALPKKRLLNKVVPVAIKSDLY